jgi:hypothetical protein
MPRPRSQNDTKTSIDLPGAWLDEAQAVAEAMRKPGMSGLSRADALRMAIRRGLDVLEAELGIGPGHEKPRRR